MLPLCTLPAGEMTNRRECGPATIAGAQYLVVDARHNYIISITSDEDKNGFSYQSSLNLQEYSVSTLPILPTATGSGVRVFLSLLNHSLAMFSLLVYLAQAL